MSRSYQPQDRLTYYPPRQCDGTQGMICADSGEEVAYTADDTFGSLAQLLPRFVGALRPVADEIDEKVKRNIDDSWSPDFHQELTITVGECRQIQEVMKAVAALSARPKSEKE